MRASDGRKLNNGHEPWSTKLFERAIGYIVAGDRRNGDAKDSLTQEELSDTATIFLIIGVIIACGVAVFLMML